jgi:hypothetical protein
MAAQAPQITAMKVAAVAERAGVTPAAPIVVGNIVVGKKVVIARLESEAEIVG